MLRQRRAHKQSQVLVRGAIAASRSSSVSKLEQANEHRKRERIRRHLPLIDDADDLLVGVRRGGVVCSQVNATAAHQQGRIVLVDERLQCHRDRTARERQNELKIHTTTSLHLQAESTCAVSYLLVLREDEVQEKLLLPDDLLDRNPETDKR